jgi:sugar diacid utilization regulator
LGRRRAQQGLPADALIQAYHIGYRELWGALVAAAEDEDPTTRELLLSAVTTVWGWVQDVTQAIARTHHSVTRGLELRSAVMRQRFLDLLISGETDTDDFSDLGHAIGFNPDGRFRAAFVTMNGDTESEEGLRAALFSIERAVVSFRAGDAIVVLQAHDVSELIATVRQVDPRASIGIGLERPGYAGARLSIGDAERAAAVAGEGAASWFEMHWLEASLLPGFTRLHDLMGPGLIAAASNPELAATVATYAECGFSLADTARRVGVHANTVTYRLDRWEELTGWNPRTFDGLTKSMASIRLQPRGDEPLEDH